MTSRAQQLQSTADRQVDELIALLSTAERAALYSPCAGREKLGDGTIAASAQHTAGNYQRIAEFVTTSNRISANHAPTQAGRHRIPRFLHTLGHNPVAHEDHRTDSRSDQYTAERIDPPAVLNQLSRTRQMLKEISQLTDRQLDTVPPKDSFRFCDGQRNLEQVLRGLLTHQGHQLDALTAALTTARLSD
jgi:hypothetical protein